MDTLATIIQNKKHERALLRSDGNAFVQMLRREGVSVVAEIKLASPSYDYRDRLDWREVVQGYMADPLIDGVSLLIDETYFAGDITRAVAIRQHTQDTGGERVPLLFKEFVIEEAQIDGARYYGYDAVLLLARCLDDETLVRLIRYTQAAELCPLVEADSPETIERALRAIWSCSGGICPVLGINCRDLSTMAIDPTRHQRYHEQYSEQWRAMELPVMALSGIDDVACISAYDGMYDGVLIGTMYMRQYMR